MLKFRRILRRNVIKLGPTMNSVGRVRDQDESKNIFRTKTGNLYT